MTKINKEGWEIKKLGEVATYPSQRVAISDLEKDEYVGVEHLLKNRAGIQRSTELPPIDNAIRFQVGDTLIGNIRPYLKKIWLADFNGGASGDVVVVRPSDDNVFPKYLYHALASDTFFEYDNLNTKGAKMPRGDRKAIAKYNIPLPPLPIQQRIVAELDEINAIISAKKQQLSKLDELAQSIFYNMFGDPVANEKGWEVHQLGSLANVKVGPFGSMLHKEDYIAGGIPLINPMHMKDFKIVVDPNFTVSKEKAEELANYLLKKNDIVFARRGDIGRCVIVAETEEGFLCGTGSLFVRFTQEIASTYIMYLVRSSSFTKELTSKAQGQTMLNLNLSIVENLPIPLPPLPLQETFATRVSAIEEQKSSIAASIEKMQTLLDARMQEYFG